MKTALVFVVGGMCAWTASGMYFVPRHERALIRLEDELSAERTARRRAESAATTADVEYRRALVELDRVRREFFNVRGELFIPTAHAEPDNIPATDLPTRR